MEIRSRRWQGKQAQSNWGPCCLSPRLLGHAVFLPGPPGWLVGMPGLCCPLLAPSLPWQSLQSAASRKAGGGVVEEGFCLVGWE